MHRDTSISTAASGACACSALQLSGRALVPIAEVRCSHHDEKVMAIDLFQIERPDEESFPLGHVVLLDLGGCGRMRDASGSAGNASGAEHSLRNTKRGPTGPPARLLVVLCEETVSRHRQRRPG